MSSKDYFRPRGDITTVLDLTDRDAQDNTYFPHMNELNLEKHYFAHYSCDPKFAKGIFPNHNIGEFPHNNVFYDTIREWYYRWYTFI